MAANKRTPIQLKNDRVRIAELYIKGVYQSVIAAELGLDQSQISRDLKAIQKQWVENTTLDLDHFKGKEIAKIDHVERVAWADYARSKQEFKSVITKGKKFGKDDKGKIIAKDKEQTVKTEERNGDPRFLDVVMKCIERRCKLIGLDAPDKHELTGKGGGPIQIEEQRAAVEERLKNDPDLAKRLKDAIGG